MFLGENSQPGQSCHHRLHGLPAGSEQELGPGDGRGHHLRGRHPTPEHEWSQHKMRLFSHDIYFTSHIYFLFYYSIIHTPQGFS